MITDHSPDTEKFPDISRDLEVLFYLLMVLESLPHSYPCTNYPHHTYIIVSASSIL